MKGDQYIYGIEGSLAPELRDDIYWIDESGKESSPIQLTNFKNEIKVLYGFQSWCPGCHSRGLPTLKKMVEALIDSDVVSFFAVQTVFEGFTSNTKEKISETQKKYDIRIPFGHDVGNKNTGNRSSIMYDYKTGGTPWFIIIDQNDRVIFNDFHLNSDKAIEYFLSV